MNQMNVVTEILQEVLPAECEIVGPSALQEIVEESEFDIADGGSNMDLGSALSILLSAAAIIKTALEIYKLLKEEHKRPATKEEFSERVEQKIITTQTLSGFARNHQVEYKKTVVLVYEKISKDVK